MLSRIFYGTCFLGALAALVVSFSNYAIGLYLNPATFWANIAVAALLMARIAQAEANEAKRESEDDFNISYEWNKECPFCKERVKNVTRLSANPSAPPSQRSAWRVPAWRIRLSEPLL